MKNKRVVFKDLNVKVDDFSLNNLNIEVESGTILGIVGRNGAGKTTLINAIAGLYNVYSGDILLNGFNRYEEESDYLRQLGIVSDEGILNIMTKPKLVNKVLKKVYDNFDEEYFLSNLEKQEIDLNKRLNKMSTGEVKKVNIITAISLNPNILVLDEPLANIDPVSKIEITELLQDYLKEDKIIIYSTNQTDELDKIADSLMFLEKGNVLVSGDKEHVLSENFLVTVNEDEFDNLKQHFIGFRRIELGYVGIINDRDLIDKFNLEYKRPNIEELMYYYIKGD